MNHLDRYIEQYNSWNALFSNEPISRPTTAAECKPLFDRLAGELSPENLCCDGELRGAALRKKSNLLYGTWKNLETIFGRTVTEDEVWGWEMWKK